MFISERFIIELNAMFEWIERARRLYIVENTKRLVHKETFQYVSLYSTRKLQKKEANDTMTEFLRVFD